MALADVVVVSYNSAATLRDCVAPLAEDGAFNVIVVDNASQDGSASTVTGLPLTLIPLDANHGFSYGCNRGWESGTEPFVLFLNPDARIDAAAVRRLVQVLVENPPVGLVAPRLLEQDGTLELSQRRFPRLRSTYAQALFLHRVFPRASWADEVVHRREAYEEERSVEWISGACVLVRREALERLGGWDEGFFLYSEDKDLCRRLHSLGYDVRYEPEASAVHLGGRSAPRARLLPVLAASRIRYAEKHNSAPAALLERVGIGLGSLTHAALTTKGTAARRGYLGALLVACRPPRTTANHLTRRDSVPTIIESDAVND